MYETLANLSAVEPLQLVKLVLDRLLEQRNENGSVQSKFK